MRDKAKTRYENNIKNIADSQLGDKVMLCVPNPNNLDSKWEGPSKIARKGFNENYIIRKSGYNITCVFITLSVVYLVFLKSTGKCEENRENSNYNPLVASKPATSRDAALLHLKPRKPIGYTALLRQTSFYGNSALNILAIA
ncbi:unnamed protein product [Euphydryas editha]|uniref:Uncharacterized protein n=1 Tax=Euphydryas editha TaxID=104508 RepID=A0AAU9TPG4_EUPED|nr:unnamed protein product [Euphydryas editha]